jgi:hypothetical protein
MRQIVYDRHAKKRMKDRSVSEDEAQFALDSPDSVLPSVKGRMNTFKYLNGRYLRITWKDEAGKRLVITVTIRKKPFME